MSLRGCAATLSPGGRATALGGSGSIVFTGVNVVDIAGTIQANQTSGSIDFVYRDQAPFIESTAVINPDPNIRADPTLLGCPVTGSTRTPTRTLVPTPTPTATVIATRRVTPTFTPRRTPTGSQFTPTPRPTPAGPADANCDGRVDANECTGVTSGIFDTGFLAVCANADANHDGRATAADYPALAQLLASGAGP
jgi:hypothetical protein